MGALITVLTVLLLINCIVLIGLILIQRGKGGGLAAFGGGGVEQAFGTRAATLAQKATAVLGVVMLVLTILLGKLYQSSSLSVEGGMEQTVPSDSAPVSTDQSQEGP